MLNKVLMVVELKINSKKVNAQENALKMGKSNLLYLDLVLSGPGFKMQSLLVGGLNVQSKAKESVKNADDPFDEFS